MYEAKAQDRHAEAALQSSLSTLDGRGGNSTSSSLKPASIASTRALLASVTISSKDSGRYVLLPAVLFLGKVFAFCTGSGTAAAAHTGRLLRLRFRLWEAAGFVWHLLGIPG